MTTNDSQYVLRTQLPLVSQKGQFCRPAVWASILPATKAPPRNLAVVDKPRSLRREECVRSGNRAINHRHRPRQKFHRRSLRRHRPLEDFLEKHARSSKPSSRTFADMVQSAIRARMTTRPATPFRRARFVERAVCVRPRERLIPGENPATKQLSNLRITESAQIAVRRSPHGIARSLRHWGRGESGRPQPPFGALLLRIRVLVENPSRKTRPSISRYRRYVLPRYLRCLSALSPARETKFSLNRWHAAILRRIKVSGLISRRHLLRCRR